MNVLIGMNHPKHYWMFRNLYKYLQRENINVSILVSAKDVLVDLLEKDNFEYVLLGHNKKGLIKKVIQLFSYVRIS